MIKINNFEVVRLVEGERPVVLIYALGEDGILYEMSGGRWVSLAIGDNVITLAEVQAQNREVQAQAQANQVLQKRAIRPKPNNDSSR